jgi:hypothetical protein
MFKKLKNIFMACSTVLVSVFPDFEKVIVTDLFIYLFFLLSFYLSSGGGAQMPG